MVKRFCLYVLAIPFLFTLGISIGAFGIFVNDALANGRYDPNCNCSRPVVRQQAPRPSSEVCVTACMSPSDWARCETKTWYADSKDRRHATPRFTSRCGTVCKPYNFPRMGYKAASGAWVVFRFGPNS